MRLKLITPSPFLPLTVEEAKGQVNIDDGDTSQETFLTDCISDATDRVSAELCQQLITATYQYTIDSIPTDGIIELPRPPLQEVISIQYYDADDELQTVDEDDYRVATDSEPGCIYFINQPAHTNRPDAIIITFSAGYGYSEDIPGPIKRAIRLLTANFFANREASSEKPQTALPLGVEYLLTPYVLRRFE